MNKKNSTKKHRTKKSSAQIKEYRHFLSSPQNQPQNTIDIYNHNLVGTAVLETASDINSQTKKPVPPPLNVRVKKFFKDHGILALIITSAFSFICWTVNSIHNTEIAIERLSTKLEYIEEALDEVKIDSNDAETLHEEISDLKMELDSKWSLDIKDIENRINILEFKVDYINE